MKLVFVSSTFRDMQFERDALWTRVVPQINDFLQKYAENVYFGDLRWGVNTTELESEESSKKVLKVCLDEIDDCKPYMIVLVGERYGWIPSADLLRQAALLKGMDPDAVSEDTSVTELEIEYGALSDPDYEGRVLFYFRNPFDTSQMSEAQRADYLSESPLHREKVQKLKEKILEKYPDHVRYYDVKYDPQTKTLTELDGFCDAVYEDLKRIFDIDLSALNALAVQERALNNSDNHFHMIAKDSFLRKQSEVLSFPCQKPDPYFRAGYESSPVFEVIQAQTGMGAKTVVAQKYLSLNTRECNTVCFSYGLDEFTNTPQSFRAALVYRLEELLSREHTDGMSQDCLAELFNEYSLRSDLPELHVFAINLPQTELYTFHVISSRYPELYKIGFHLHFRNTLPGDFVLPFYPKNRICTVPGLSSEEIEQVIASQLRIKRKELPEIVISEIKRHKGCASVLYLSLLIERLTMLDFEDFSSIREMGDGMDNINRYMISLIRDLGDDVASLSQTLFKELAERVNKEMIPHIIAHLTLKFHFADDGMREFFTYCGWNYSSVDYTLFKKTFPSLVYQDSKGIVFFTNDQVALGARALLAEIGQGNDMDKVIEFLYSKSERYRWKALPRMLYDAGRAEEFLDHYLRYIDVSAEIASSKSEHTEENELFVKSFNDMSGILRQSEMQADGFVVSVFECLGKRMLEGRIKNTYTVLSGIFHFIEPDFSSREGMERLLETLMSIVNALDSINAERSCNDLEILIGVFRTAYIPIFYGEVVKKEHIEFCTLNQRYQMEKGQALLGSLYELQKNGVIDLEFTGNLRVTSYCSTYQFIKACKGNVPDGVYQQFRSLCAGLERHATEHISDYYGRVSRGDGTVFSKVSIETQSFWHAMNGYRHLLEGNNEMAELSYKAFYLCHQWHFKDRGIHGLFLPGYVNLIRDYCEYLINTENPEMAQIYTELFEWCFKTVMEGHCQQINATGALLKLFNLGVMNRFIDNGERYYFSIFGAVLPRIHRTTDAVLHDETVTAFLIFSFVYESENGGGEKLERFKELMLNISGCLLGSTANTENAVKELALQSARYVDFEEMSDCDGVVRAVLDAVMDQHCDVFSKDRDLYMKLALSEARAYLSEE